MSVRRPLEVKHCFISDDFFAFKDGLTIASTVAHTILGPALGRQRQEALYKYL